MPCYHCLARVLFFSSFVCNYTNDSSPSILFSSRIPSRRFIIQRFTIVLFPWLTLIADLLSIWVRHHNSNVPGIKFSFRDLVTRNREIKLIGIVIVLFFSMGFYRYFLDFSITLYTTNNRIYSHLFIDALVSTFLPLFFIFCYIR